MSLGQSLPPWFRSSTLTVCKESARSIPGKWKEVFPPIRSRLLQLMVNRPWAYCDHATLISDTSCLVMVTDASDTAVAVSLFRVLGADASTVTKAGLLDPSLSRLVAVTHRKLNTAQCKWLTFEAELHAIVLGCTKFGGFITTATDSEVSPWAPPQASHPE